MPDRDQTRAMVTSLWVCCDCVGGYLGATLGSQLYDHYGWNITQLVIVITSIVGVIIMMVNITVTRTSCTNIIRLFSNSV